MGYAGLFDQERSVFFSDQKISKLTLVIYPSKYYQIMLKFEFFYAQNEQSATEVLRKVGAHDRLTP